MEYNTTNDLFPVYQAANSDSSNIIKKNFIIHEAEFSMITGSLLNRTNHDPLQHELILGQRGSGKSTLLKRIEIEVQENSKLKKNYLPINLAEEQAGVYRLLDLWEQTLQELRYQLQVESTLQEFSKFPDEQGYTRYLYQQIHETCAKHRKKIVLLLDNFDRIVENFTDDGSLLRETLINHNDVAFIATSTHMSEDFWRYDKPFYEFFRRHHLEALSHEEAIQLLNHWSDNTNTPQVKTFIAKHPGKVENIRLLTDGLPRTMRFFMEIILQSKEPKQVDFLKKIMDNATPQYQEQLANLTPPMRKIVVEMAFIWEACSAKQLSEKCKMESKLISANLKTLAEKNIADKIPTDKRNHLYRLSERFFNMWLIVTQGNPDQKRKARWLSIFLENWYDAQAIQQLEQQHIVRLQEHKQEATTLTKAPSLSKASTIHEKNTIIEPIQTQPSTRKNYLWRELPQLNMVAEATLPYLTKKDLEKIQKSTHSTENKEDILKDSIKKPISDEEHQHSDAEKQHPLAIKGDNNALFNLALLYYSQNKNKEKAKQYISQYTGEFSTFAIAIEIWAGIFNNVENRITSALRENTDGQAFFIEQLLIQHQKSLVHKLFNHPEFGKKLQAQYTVLHYTCRILNNMENDNLMLKIPPELHTPIDDILSKIKKTQQFYAGNYQ
ncbi:MAG: AAA family ATPase [Prevotellaceae bacterium]|jgi:adenylate kinase family enzyme|nr:AAA family ATPase [Prevotellaceae bacterium]